MLSPGITSIRSHLYKCCYRNDLGHHGGRPNEDYGQQEMHLLTIGPQVGFA
jgi:hypothetical protein